MRESREALGDIVLEAQSFNISLKGISPVKPLHLKYLSEQP
jgi:hypothetical protein